MMLRQILGVATAIACLAVASCAHTPVEQSAWEIESSYKNSYNPPPGYGRIYIFPINQRVLGIDHFKTTDVYIGSNKIFTTQIKEGYFSSFDIPAGKEDIFIKFLNVPIVDQSITIKNGETIFLQPNWDKRPNAVAVSPLMLFGAVGGVLAAVSSDQAGPGLQDIVNPALAMQEVQNLHLASISAEVHGLVKQDIK